MKRIKSFMKRHPAITVFLGIQLVAIVFLVGSLFRPKAVITSGLSDFLDVGYEGCVFNQEQNTIELSYGFGPGRATRTSNHVLKSGAYRVYVKYSAVTNIEEPSYSIKDSNGTIEFVSETNSFAMSGHHIVLNDLMTEQEAYIWIPFWDEVKDFNSEIIFNAMGYITIKDYTVEEVVSYRYIRLFGYLLLFLFLDLLVWAITDKKFKIGAIDRRTFILLTGMIVASSIPMLADYIYENDDIHFHIGRIVSLAKSLREGQFPVRIDQTMIYGYGYANPIFYNPLFMYIPAFLYLCAVPLYRCYQVYVILVNGLTCGISYFSFQKLFKNKKWALIGTLLYMIAPYRLMNIYNRGALGEFTAMAFFPLILYGIWVIYSYPDDKRIKWTDCMPLILGASGVISCHLLSTVMVVEFVVLFCVLRWNKTFRPWRLLALFKSAVAIVLINLYWIWPFFDSYQMNLSVKNGGNWIAGTGLSLMSVFNVFSFLAGYTKDIYFGRVAQIGCVGIAAILMLVFYYWNKEKWNGAKPEHGKEIGFTFGLGILAVFFSTKYMPWGAIAYKLGKLGSIINTVQFAWRYLAIATPLLVVAFVFLAKLIMERYEKIGRYIVIFTVSLSVFALVDSYCDYLEHAEVWYAYAENDTIKTKNVAKGEYLLVGTVLDELGVRKVTTSSELLSYGELNYQNGISTIYVENESDAVQYIDIPILHYDNYHVVDQSGIEFPIENGVNNVIRVNVPTDYSGILIVYYKSPKSWRISEIISAFTVFIFAAFYFTNRVRANKNEEIK
ncbi:MAG: hypothetical protein ACI4S2_15535 [Lachnospiraceae bacterium]